MKKPSDGFRCAGIFNRCADDEEFWLNEHDFLLVSQHCFLFVAQHCFLFVTQTVFLLEAGKNRVRKLFAWFFLSPEFPSWKKIRVRKFGSRSCVILAKSKNARTGVGRHSRLRRGAREWCLQGKSQGTTEQMLRHESPWAGRLRRFT